MVNTTQLDESTLEKFGDRIRGEILRVGDARYDKARSVWNGMIDKEPAVIVQCTGTADVATAINFVREQELDFAVKSGGHHIAGHAVCDDGLVADLSAMNAVRVSPDARRVRVQGGATWGDVNHETLSFGLVTAGIPYPDVGVAGYTLGGGIGVLTRIHGLAIDSLRGVDVVTAEGELVHASNDENPDLFWAIRGGGGNFGVVTSFEFDCYEAPSDILTGRFLYPFETAPDVLRFYRDFMASAPDEVFSSTVVIQVPSTPEFPEEIHGETVLAVGLFYAGDSEDGEQAIQPFREFGDPILDVVRPQSYRELGLNFLEQGRRNHWKSHFLSELSDEAIDTFVDHAASLPTPASAVGFDAIGGSMNRTDEKATAFPHRDAAYLFSPVVQWEDAERDDEIISWVREFHEAMAPYATGGEYVNNQTDDDLDRVRAAYGDNYERLVEIKTEWDPENLFRRNQNIEPAS